LVKIPSLNKDIFLYGFGTSGKWLSSNIKGRIRGFIDSDTKKTGLKFNNIPVYSIEEAKKLINKNTLIIVTVLDIQDVISTVESLSAGKWLPLGKFLNNEQVINNPLKNEDKSYVEYSLKAVESCHKSYFSTKKLFLKSIDIIITEKCSLKCKDCSNLMQYYMNPINVSFNEILNDFQTLINNVDHIYEIRLIGGEPFMNKDIYKIIKEISKNEKLSRIVIYTNATIPLKEKYIDILKHSKVVFSVTTYGKLSKNTQKVIDFLKKNKIPYRDHPPENWTDCGVIYDFKRKEPEMEKLFEDCCGKNLLTVTNGKLYRCPFVANAERLNAIPKDSDNYVNVNDSKKNIKKYTTQINYIPACNYCMGRSYNAPKIKPAIQTKKPLDYKTY
jgi:organic radical activating enzyme